MADRLCDDEFMRCFADSEDDLISELVYLLEHEPQRGGFFGVSKPDWDSYQSELGEAIAALET